MVGQKYPPSSDQNDGNPVKPPPPLRAPALLLALVAPYLSAQPVPPAPQSVDLRYVGAGVRVGVRATLGKPPAR